MDRETLSNYGWIVVLVLILAVMMALASPFGSFVSTAIKGVTDGFWDVNSASLNAVGLDTGDIGFDGDPASCGVEGHCVGDGKEHGVPVENCTKGHRYTCECGWEVPENSTYYVGVTNREVKEYDGATKIYNAGDLMPCGYTPAYQDVFVSNGYEYRYNAYYKSSSCYWKEDNKLNGWGVRWLDFNATSCTQMLDIIQEKPIKTMKGTFFNCSELTSIPNIPNTVVDMSGAFANCSALKSVPDIPNSVLGMDATFSYCTSLVKAPVLSNKLGDFGRTFYNCTSLVEAPIIPSSVYCMSDTFSGCTNLKTYAGSKDADGDFSNYKLPNATFLTTFKNCDSMILPPAIPTNVTKISDMFSGCNALTTAPSIPNKITDVSGAFSNCTNLKTYVGSKDADGDFSNYIIPNGVKDTDTMFWNCKSLTIAPTLPNSITDMSSMFNGCSSLKSISNISSNATNMNNAFNGCASLTAIPTIPSTVTDLSNAFYNCTSLTTVPAIPSKVTNLSRAFYGCASLVNTPDMSQANDVTDMQATFSGCTSLKNSPVIPSKVTNMQETFLNCTSLTNINSSIPATVTNMQGTFSGCTSLTGTIEINANIKYASVYTPVEDEDTFKGVNFETQSITLTGSSNELDTLGYTGTKYCYKCNGKCLNNH